MSGNQSALLGAGKPLRTTKYTSGTGTHTFLSSASLSRITMSGGGGGGARSGNTVVNAACGGSAAATVSTMLRFNSASLPYAVGAAGVGATESATAGTNGGNSTFGGLLAKGGLGGAVASSTDIVGASIGNYLASATAVLTDVAGMGAGIAGGHGGAGGANPANGASGGAANYPAVASGVGARNGTSTGASNVGGFGGAGGGGDSALGNGGSAGALGVVGANGTGFGAGGGAGGPQTTSANGGNGSPGIIIIEEY